MSVVVHVFASPTPESARHAQALIDTGTIEQGAASPTLPAFAEALRARYPDAHTLEARGESGDGTVWADSPLEADASQPMMTLGLLLSNADDDFWPFLAHTAADHGLHLYDPQRGTLWTPRGRVLDFDGGEAAFPPRPATGQPASRPVRFPLADDAILERIFVRLEPAVSPRGWRFHREGHYQSWYARRQCGSVGQVLSLWVSGGQLDPDCTISARFGFEEPAVGALLREVVPEDAARLEIVKSNLGDRYTDVWAYVHEIFGALAKPVTPGTFARARDLAELDAWIDRFGDWLAGRAGTLLDATSDLRALARLMLGEQRRSRLSTVGGHDVLGLLALAHLAKDPGIDFETWVAVALDQCDRNYGSARRNAREIPHRAHEWKDSLDMARHIELLIERLRARRPTLTLAPLG